MHFNKKVILLFFVLVLTSKFNWSQNIAPTLTASGNQPYCPQSEINIVTDFDIVDPDDTEIDALFIQISTGYVQGEDTLLLTGTHANIQTSWSAVQGKLELSGIGSNPVSYVDLIAATKDVVFKSTNENPVDKAFSITIGDANFLPSTNHYYEYVSSVGITWENAKTAAEGRTYYGLQGYLATITSAEEAQLSGEQAAGAGWIGGSDAQTEGVWKWVTGPENGTIFWNGSIGGTTPNFANWNNNEPNNAGNEDYAHVTAPGIGIRGSWNDLTNTGNSSGDYQPKGYIVEYGGMPGDAVLNISASTNIYTASIVSTKPASRCGNGVVNLSAIPSDGDVLWFSSNDASATSIFTGDTYSPNISSTTTFYALASINGCSSGVRVPVVATVNEVPTIDSVSENVKICETGSVVLSATASSGVIDWYETQVGGTSLGSGTTYTTTNLTSSKTFYVEATFNGCTSLTRTPVDVTVQITSAPLGNSAQSFCDIEAAKISDIEITGTDVLWYENSTGGNPLNEETLLTNNTTYYASQTINGCESKNRFAVDMDVYETVELPSLSTIPDLFECDTDVDGDNANGFTTFNLTTNETILLNGKSTNDFVFEYYLDAGYSTPIATPSTDFENTNKDVQTIYVSIVNKLDNSCQVNTSFDINVQQLPDVQSSIVFKNCDADGVPDGATNFNLNEIDDIVTNGNTAGVTITYHLNLANAESNTDSLNPDNFNNADAVANTIYARVENSNTGCYNVSEIKLEVSTTSFPSGYNYELEFCDDDSLNDGFRVFNLSDANASILSQFPTGQNLSVHYYRNLSDAQLEQNEISQHVDYVNEVEFMQRIYVRVESDDNGDCFGLGEHLTLIVNPRPEFETDQSEIFCFDGGSIILSTFNPNQNDYAYKWTDETGAVISNFDYAEISTSGTYTVVATSRNSCESFPVELTVVESAEAQLTQEDVTINELNGNNSVTINNENNNLGIGDYEFAINNINGPYQDQAFFDRLASGTHVLFAKDKNGCGISSLEIFILGFPKFFTPNNDGQNDTWEIKGLGSGYTNASRVSVYNRYGKLIKQLNAINDSWDGTFKGQVLPDSDYWFVAQLVEFTGETKTIRGHFSLVR